VDFPTTCGFGFEDARGKPKTKIHPSIDRTYEFLRNIINFTTLEPKLDVHIGVILIPLTLPKTPNLT